MSNFLQENVCSEPTGSIFGRVESWPVLPANSMTLGMLSWSPKCTTSYKEMYVLGPQDLYLGALKAGQLSRRMVDTLIDGLCCALAVDVAAGSLQVSVRIEPFP